MSESGFQLSAKPKASMRRGPVRHISLPNFSNLSNPTDVYNNITKSNLVLMPTSANVEATNIAFASADARIADAKSHLGGGGLFVGGSVAPRFGADAGIWKPSRTDRCGSVDDSKNGVLKQFVVPKIKKRSEVERPISGVLATRYGLGFDSESLPAKPNGKQLRFVKASSQNNDEHNGGAAATGSGSALP
jgi:hypothetical protein